MTVTNSSILKTHYIYLWSDHIKHYGTFPRNLHASLCDEDILHNLSLGDSNLEEEAQTAILAEATYE
jgi:hypothetical protein